ncbi:ribonuclease H2, subunit B [Ephemerocybe angulata]|uniref:Ribonuclease H2 subunit B n=1 Tax=Ephemerocybe angulata TaxID=980116 RepID=A0A8H6MCR7_9AGAR|nr:ribonuclease H2, subunit B [Tulosesus angulatus]
MATHFAILPEGVIQTLTLQLQSNGYQYLSLPHPRTGHFALFLPTDTGILEVQAVSPANARSWFLEQEVVEDGKLLVMTPNRPCFLTHSSFWKPLKCVLHTLPALLGFISPPQSTVFRTTDDTFEQICQNIKSIARLADLKCTQDGLRRICETKELSPDMAVYRYSKERAIQYLKRKADRMARSKDLDQSKTIIRNLARDGLMEDGKETLLEQGRIKAACELVGQYLSPAVKAALLSSYDLSALDKHLRANAEAEIPLKVATNTTKGKAAAAKGDDAKKRKAPAKGANTTGMAKTLFEFLHTKRRK